MTKSGGKKTRKRRRQFRRDMLRPAKIHKPLASDPTAEEIAEICAEIQSEWSEEEKARRAGVRMADDFRYEIPQGMRLSIK